jgi:predicted RNA-binding Zn-ribbon protein involved in translation (DUF1610 family)
MWWQAVSSRGKVGRVDRKVIERLCGILALALLGVIAFGISIEIIFGYFFDCRLAVAAFVGAIGCALIRERLREVSPERRIRQHLCSACGYDLTGNTSGVCPECGRAVESSGTDRVESQS